VAKLKVFVFKVELSFISGLKDWIA